MHAAGFCFHYYSKLERKVKGTQCVVETKADSCDFNSGQATVLRTASDIQLQDAADKTSFALLWPGGRS